MQSPQHSTSEILSAIEHWVTSVVVRHRFCPFAKPALEADWVSYQVLDGGDSEAVLKQIAECISQLLARNQPDATELLILSDCAESFDDYLDLSAIAEALIESMGWRESIQLATFHPQYCFAETSPDSIENYTNRAPWPVIQLLQVDSVGRAIDKVGSTDEIPTRNVDYLQAMDDATADLLLRDSCPPTPNH